MVLDFMPIMKFSFKKSILLLFLFVCMGPAQGQLFEQLYDVDSTFDYGNDIMIQPDSSYMIIGTAEQPDFQFRQLMTMIISPDGNHKINKHLFGFGPQDCYPGNPGTAV